MTRGIAARISQLLFSIAWAGANGGEIQIVIKNLIIIAGKKKQWELLGGK